MIVTLLLKVMAKSVSPYALMESSLFLCGLLSQSVMGQLKVGIAKLVLSAIYYVNHKHTYLATVKTSGHLWQLLLQEVAQIVTCFQHIVYLNCI